MPRAKSAELVRAAGFVVVHRSAGATRLLLLENALRREWGFPKGHLDPGEDLYAAAVRELAEETGIDRFTLVPGFRHTTRHVLPSGKNKGLTKETVYVLAEASSDGVEISREHSAARWCTLDEAVALLPFESLRDAARAACHALTSAAP
jgi:8-oxo-dGTP pyrophosphatase MutT (NUDIX family)